MLMKKNLKIRNKTKISKSEQIRHKSVKIEGNTHVKLHP
jgi:hypothetical protein